jgi:hypothetical protein
MALVNNDSQQAIPPNAEEQRNSKKIYRWKCGLTKEVSGWLAPARVICP